MGTGGESPGLHLPPAGMDLQGRAPGFTVLRGQSGAQMVETFVLFPEPLALQSFAFYGPGLELRDEG